MADLVINHASRYSKWFQNFRRGEEPGENYFLEADPDLDLSEVVRPRNSPLLTPVQTEDGNKCVWTTFSEDQVDLDFTNMDVLFEYLDIFLYYVSKGIQIVRLDAIAYLWKKIGTSCIHLPETHEVVKLFRTLVDQVAPHVTLITETNVPHKENISYFGNGDDEAHMVYQFSLPRCCCTPSSPIIPNTLPRGPTAWTVLVKVVIF
ncbi:MAG: alpha-amylase family glycosyl hydrolase [Balneolaceae bacterium]|nr:alpha-amylase family glycosyl hydrolase [Balneolaceae bacterium]